jgi:hypothetical protein
MRPEIRNVSKRGDQQWMNRIDETGDRDMARGDGTPHPCDLNEGGVVRICCGAVCFASMVKHTVRSLIDGAKKTARTANAHEPNEVVPRRLLDRPAIGTWREGAGTPHPCELNEGGLVRICCGAVCFASMVKLTVRSLLDGAKKTERTADAHEPNEVVPRRLLDR